MQSLEGRRVIVTGGTRGVGLGIVEALVARHAKVTVLARDADRLATVARRLGVDARRGDVADEALARSLVAELRPEVVVFNAGAPVAMAPLHQITWEQFRSTWELDVKAGLYWIQQCLRLPLAPGSRVIVTASGAALQGSPLSGGYAGAKRMLWFMAEYANGVSAELGLGIHFQVLVQRQIIDTDLGRAAAEVYAAKKGVSVEQFFAGFGAPMTPREIGEHVAAVLTDPAHARTVAFSVKGDTGLRSLDDAP